jgi:elongation factor P
MLAKEIKPGTIVVFNEAPHAIESMSVQSPSARGGATLYKFRARNLVTKQKADFTLKGTEGLPDADFAKREVTFMFADTEVVHFLDSGDYNQYSMPRADVANEMQYVTEDLQGMLALKGNSATSRTKPAKLETGVQVNVPEYLKQGEKIRVDTRSGEFLARA